MKSNDNDNKIAKNKVIVTGMNYSTTLGVIRALGTSGYDVDLLFISFSKNPNEPVIKSKYIKKIFFSGRDEESIINTLISKMANPMEKQLIIPSDDLSASLIDKNSNKLSSHFIIPMIHNNSGKLIEYMDKLNMKSMAEKSGLNVAKGYTIDIQNGSFSIPDDIVYPCFAKPQISINIEKIFIRKCNNINELTTLLREVAETGDNRMLIEEYLPIDAEYVVPGAALNEIAVIPAIIRKTMTATGYHKGVTAMGKVVADDSVKQIIKDLAAFVSSLGFTGLFDIELIESKGKFYFNEINLRNGAATYGITAAGVNLPVILADYMLNGIIPETKYTIKNGMTFASEKVLFSEYISGCISWKEYKRCKKAEVNFIYNKDDIEPYKCFRQLEIKVRIKKIIHKL